MTIIHLPYKYTPPKATVYNVVIGKLCIGFGEGSIPPEDSDCNISLFDDDFSENYALPKSRTELWDE